MANVQGTIDELVAANRILANENVVDAFGHISARHPERPDRFFLSCSRSPELVSAADIMEFTLEGEAVDPQGRRPYLERFIHGAVFEARPDVHSVVHCHSPTVIPFGVTGEKLRPIMHNGGCLGHDVPVWDIGDKFGPTNLLVINMEMGRDLAKAVGPNTTTLMRGHGAAIAAPSVRRAVFIAIYLELNADLQMKAMQIKGGKPIKFLSEGEIDATSKMAVGNLGGSSDRAWEYWCRRAGVGK
jgi:HCOMODA/2-hydroxy-3-carboxy-muconic semialdehyde decarboxylase